jgi:hypothetical protein
MASMRVAAVLVGVVLVAVVGVVLVINLGSAGTAAPTADMAPHYVEEAAAAGISHAYEGDFDYFVGGGVAAFDCNADGLPELYLAGGSAPAALFINRSSAGGALRFEPLPSPTTDLTAVVGAYPIDIDGDGLTDLAVLRRGANELLRGLGDCRFESANQRWSFEGGDSWTTAFSAKWDAGSPWPTIAVGNYLSSADPNSLACADNQLFLPAAAGGGFAPPVALSPGWCTLSMLFTDWDRSGRRDLRVTNDRHYYGDASAGEDQLWRMEAGQAPRLYGADDGWRTVRVFGMGIASYDVNGDGYPDYYLTSQGDNKLQALADGPGRPTYADIALRSGVTATRPYAGDTSLASTAWHDEFADVNNDGLIDLFVAKGNVEAQLDLAVRDPSNLFIGQPDGTFVEGAVDAGIVDYARARGGALVDLNHDGLLDLVEVVRVENVRLYRNVGSGSAAAPAAMGNWIEVRLAQAEGNRDAIGAWLEVRVGERTMLREVTIGGGHVSGQLGMVHFGLGSATSAQVRVTWPDGEVGEWQNVSADQRLLVERGAAAPVALP